VPFEFESNRCGEIFTGPEGFRFIKVGLANTSEKEIYSYLYAFFNLDKTALKVA
jgi:hypothetical protein